MAGTSKALTIAQAYFEAMATKNTDGIAAISAEDVICTSPVGRFEVCRHSAVSRKASPR